MSLATGRLFISTNERTFQYEDDLPSLPVPRLEETLQKYLESVKPFLTEQEYRHTASVVLDFGRGIGMDLHQKLLLHAHHHKNWLEKWWEDVGYLESRQPLAILGNFSGVCPFIFSPWPPAPGTQVERMALVAWYSLKYWQLIRREQLKVDKTRDGRPLSMKQMHRLFSMCRIPGETKDHLAEHFKTVSEGPAPTHIVVFCRGRIFTFNGIDEDNEEPLTALEIQAQLNHIMHICDDAAKGPGVGILTSENRTTWYRLREHMIADNEKNKHYLHLIESSVMTITFEDSEPDTFSKIGNIGLKGDFNNRWSDKTYSFIALKNGTITCMSDHTPIDGIAPVMAIYFTHLELAAVNGKWKGSKHIRNLPPPEEIQFDISNTVHEGIVQARKKFILLADTLQSDALQYAGYGKDLLRSFKLHPDTCVQLALQYTYYRMYGKPAPTYETASTRQFHHGRTETVRSCTVEAMSWARSMLDPSISDEGRLRLFLAAMNRHLKLMREAESGQGFDRHLLGLAQIAKQNGYPTHEIFTDKAFTKSGGGGNFILSTSFVGFTPVSGVIAPMCEHGYGVFYNILPKSLCLFMTRWTKDKDTNLTTFSAKLSESFDDIRKILESSWSKVAKI